ncbi:MAG: hydroxymethylbilane synthase [Hyphomonadaceae bacterium]
MSGEPINISIGTRGSPLALQQAEQVKALLEEQEGNALTCTIVPLTTTGDRLTTQRLTEAGGKGLFTKELDIALDEGRVDIAVHSLKDVPTELPPGQSLVAFMKREDAREGFVSHKYDKLEDMDEGAILGTASIRREAQSRLVRPDLKIVTFRGNVQTRLKKLEAGEADATYLAMAGLSRLDMANLARPIPLEDMLPAPCQGIVAISANTDQLPAALAEGLKVINNKSSERAAAAERGFLAALDGSCRTPIAAHMFVEDGMIRFVGEVTQPDGTACWEKTVYGSVQSDLEELAAIGRTAALSLLDEAGPAFPVLDGGPDEG